MGRLLMQHTENYAKKYVPDRLARFTFSCDLSSFSFPVIFRLGFSRLVLSTHNAQDFYTKLGYEECLPVTTMSTFADSSLLSKVRS